MDKIVFSPCAFSDTAAKDSLNHGRAHIWLLDLQELDADIPDRFQHVLSPTELARAQSFSRRQREFVATRAFMRLCLARYTNQAPGSLQLAVAEEGKPYLANSSLQFNLSHCANLVALAVGNYRLGLDIEIERKRAFMDIAQRYFHPTETAYLGTANTDAQPALFFRFWTLKEALLKALGGGIATGLDKASFSFHHGAIQASLASELEQRATDWQFSQHKLAEKTWLALASCQPVPLVIDWFNGGELFRL